MKVNPQKITLKHPIFKLRFLCEKRFDSAQLSSFAKMRTLSGVEGYFLTTSYSQKKTNIFPISIPYFLLL
jgi:hypothetical protein